MNEYLKVLIFFLFYFIIIKINKDDFYKQEFMMKKERILYDVLFINGCNTDFFPQPYRNRIMNQIEQLKAGNLNSMELF